MKISYILQLKDFSIMLLFGIIIGFIFGFFNIMHSIKKIYIFQIITDLIFSIIATALFIILINIINYGQIRFFLIVGYLMGFVLERITLGKLFAKGFKYVYNRIIMIAKRFRESKLGRIIFK